MDTLAKLERCNAALVRCYTRIHRASNRARKLEREKARLEARLKRGEPVKEKPAPVARPEPAQVSEVVKPAATPDKEPSSLDIPALLRRAVPNAADKAAAEAIKAEQETRRKAKAKGGAERRAAQRRGDLKRMPLTGKAALEFIRNGDK